MEGKSKGILPRMDEPQANFHRLKRKNHINSRILSKDLGRLNKGQKRMQPFFSFSCLQTRGGSLIYVFALQIRPARRRLAPDDRIEPYWVSDDCRSDIE